MLAHNVSDWLDKIALASEFETPYVLTDLNIIEQKCKAFKAALPEVGLFYAIKAFSDLEVIRTVDPYVDGFDAASVGEIDLLLSAGIAPSRIAYSNPVKSEQSIAKAATSGVDKFAFQSFEELEKIARQAKGAEVYVRVKMDDAHSAVPLSVKYGCASEEVVELLKAAKRLGLKPVGITFHVGSQQTGFEAWTKAIQKSQELVAAARQAGLEDVALVNMGGGFPTRYFDDDPLMEDVAQSVNAAIGKSDMPLTYMAEPGRYIVADSSVIIASVIGIERRGHKAWVYLDVGLFQAFMGAQRYDEFPYYPYSLRHVGSASRNIDTTEYVLTGPSCDSQDIITFDAPLPSDLRVGDKLAFPNVGAYTVVYGSDFNGFAVPPRLFIESRAKDTDALRVTASKGLAKV